MNEKRFTWKTEKLQHSDDEVLMVVDNANEEWKGHILNIVDLLNEQQSTIEQLQDLCGESDSENAKLRIENEQLKKQIQIYEQLISNSYVGEEETLDGFVGKYVIWEDELQKYRKKIRKEDN